MSVGDGLLMEEHLLVDDPALFVRLDALQVYVELEVRLEIVVPRVRDKVH